MLFNLLVYATEGMDSGTALKITSSNSTSKKMLGKKYNPNAGNYVRLSVVANGKHVAQETLTRLLTPC
jgi:hypothetical protein